MLQSQIGDIVRAIHKQLREKSIKTRQGCFSLLTELVLVLPGALADHFSALVPGIQYSLGLVLKDFIHIIYIGDWCFMGSFGLVKVLCQIC